MTSRPHRTIFTAHQTLALMKRYNRWLAAAMLAAMFGLSFGAMVGDSAIVDEVAHIPAAYSYVHYADYRLNPEHPPLIKDLAGIPLQFLDVRFPDDRAAWTTEPNGQWNTGWDFLYHVGNNADEILFWSRLPILVLAIGFGAWLYRYVRRAYGTGAALLTLTLYAFSPNFLAHSHYVTTDLGASVFMFMTLAAFVRFIKQPSWPTWWWLTGALTAAQLTKFSSVLLLPFMAAVSLGWIITQARTTWMRRAQILFGGLATASLMSLVGIWLVYLPQTAGMPDAVQDRLIEASIYKAELTDFKHALEGVNNIPGAKPLVQYVLGVTMVYGRVKDGNTTYFNGVAANHSFAGYFPELILFKTQTALIIVGFGLVLFGIRWLGRDMGHVYARVTSSFKTNVAEWVFVGFAAFYLAASIFGNLNLGIRHVLPIFVPLFVVVAVRITGFLRTRPSPAWLSAAVVLVGWYVMSAILAYPSYTAYFNELGGGRDNAYRYFSDSNVDWGQDLKRLKAYTQKHPEIRELGLDYFGGGVPEYYFCQRRYDAQRQLIMTDKGYDCSGSVFRPWHADSGEYPGTYLAVSETFLQNDRYFSAGKGYSGYEYIRNMTPIERIGGSIYLYKLR